MLNFDSKPEGRFYHQLAKIEENKILLYGGNTLSEKEYGGTWILTMDSETNYQEDIITDNPNIEFSNKNLTIYHNLKPSNLIVEIYNLYGQLINKFQPQYSSHIINIPNIDLASGIYLIRIMSNQNIYNGKLIIN